MPNACETRSIVTLERAADQGSTAARRCPPEAGAQVRILPGAQCRGRKYLA